MTESQKFVTVNSSKIKQTLQIMTWMHENGYFQLSECVDAIKAWDKVGGDEESVDFILTRYYGRFDNRDEFLEEWLESRGTLRELQKVSFTVPKNGTNYLSFDYLDKDYLWDTLFQYRFWGGFYYDELVSKSTPYYYVFYKDI